MGIGYVLGWVRLVGGQANRATYRGMGMGKSMGMGMGMVWYGGGAIDHTHTHTHTIVWLFPLPIFFFLFFSSFSNNGQSNQPQSIKPAKGTIHRHLLSFCIFGIFGIVFVH